MNARISFAAAAVTLTLALSPSLGLASTAPGSTDEARRLAEAASVGVDAGEVPPAISLLTSTDDARSLAARRAAGPAFASAWLAGGPLNSTDEARRVAACRRAGDAPAPVADEPALACSLR